MIAQRHGGRWIAPAALGVGLQLALGACADPATHTEPAGSAADGAAVADLTNDGATCEEELSSGQPV